MTTIFERAKLHKQAKLDALLTHIEACAVCAMAAWASIRRDRQIAWPGCDEGSRLVLLALHASDYPSGVDVVLAGECPLGNQNPMACLECRVGHASECHYPNDCQTAHCAHADRDLIPVSIQDPSTIALDHIREIRRDGR